MSNNTMSNDKDREATPDQSAFEEAAVHTEGFIDSHVESQARRLADHVKGAEALFRKLPGVRKGAS